MDWRLLVLQRGLRWLKEEETSREKKKDQRRKMKADRTGC